MINADYVSFETAKLLKEKGFDGSCHRYYRYDKEDIDGNGKMFMFASDLNGFCCVTNSLLNDYGDKHEETVLAPTFRMAIKWLREVHNLSVEVQFFLNEENGTSSWNYDIIDIITYCNKAKYDMCVNFKTYEQAAEAAIKYCLENLI